MYEINNITKMNLSGNDLSAQRIQFSQFPNLKFLHIGGCKLKELPKCVGELKELEYLNLCLLENLHFPLN